MVQIIPENPRKRNFSSQLGLSLGQGVSHGLMGEMEHRRDMSRDFARQMASGKNQKQEEKLQALSSGLDTLGRMKQIVTEGNVGKGSGLSSLWNSDVRRARSEFEQLGKSLIPIVAAGVPIRNQREFEEYKKILTDPSAFDDEILGAIAGLESLFSRNLQGGEEEHPLMKGKEIKKKDFSELALPQQEEPPMGMGSGPSKLRSLLSAAPKGAIKSLEGISDLLHLPIDLATRAIAPEFSEKERQFKEQRAALTEKFLPTKEGGIEDVLQFAGEQAPFVALGPASLAAKGVAAFSGGVAKKAAKELKMPEIIQDLAAGVGSIAPNLAKAVVSKALVPAASDQAVVDFLRSKGLSERQITPLIQNPAKLSALSKISTKYKYGHEFLKDIQGSLGGIYQDIYSRGAHKALTGNGLTQFTNNLQKTIQSLPPVYRETMKKELGYLFEEPITYKTLAEFKDGINKAIGETGRRSRKAVVGKLKGPVDEAMAHLDKGLFQEERLLDSAYAKMKNFSSSMSKKEAENFFKLEKIAPTATAILTLNFIGLPKLAIGAAAAPKIAKELLTNPRLQRMHAKMWDQFKKGKLEHVARLADLIEKQIASSQEG
jgi:hypothetical protein